MSLELARRIGLSIQGDRIKFKMVDGTAERSLGYVLVDCSLVTAKTSKQQKFHIFATPNKPLIMGGPFLYDSGILMKSPSPSREALDLNMGIQLLPPTPNCASHHYLLYLIRVEAECFHISAEAIAIADLGSDIELMSLTFAQAQKFPIQRERKIEAAIQTANGKVVRSKGVIEATICLANNYTHRHRFVVIENLPFEVILGRSFVTQQKLLKKPIYQFHHHMAFDKQHSCYDVMTLSKTLEKMAGQMKTEPGEKYVKQALKCLKEYEAEHAKYERHKSEYETFQGESEKQKIVDTKKAKKLEEKKKKLYKEAQQKYRLALQKAEDYYDQACDEGYRKWSSTIMIHLHIEI